MAISSANRLDFYPSINESFTYNSTVKKVDYFYNKLGLREFEIKCAFLGEYFLNWAFPFKKEICMIEIKQLGVKVMDRKRGVRCLN